MEEDHLKKPTAPTQPSKFRRISDTAFLALTSVVLLGVYATSYLASVAGAGFKNTTEQVSDKYFTQVG